MPVAVPINVPKIGIGINEPIIPPIAVDDPIILFLHPKNPLYESNAVYTNY